ncbi:MAG: hypothetical protein ACE5J2_07365 [Nitrososphaerales archaeon]
MADILDIWQVRCSNCGYGAKLTIGSTELAQTYSDLNEDYAFYQLFVCPKEREFVIANVQNRDFDNTCPAHGGKLVPATDIPPKKCPKCGADIEAKKIDVSESIG